MQRASRCLIFVARTLVIAVLASSVAPARTQGLGALSGDARFLDARYLERSLSDLGPARATVIAFVAHDCPLAQRSLALLADLDRERRSAGVRFLALDPSGDADVVEIAACGVAAGAEFPFGVDEGGALARALHVVRTPTVCVLDGEHRAVYLGRVDGAQRLGGDVAADARSDLREALEDVLAARPVRVATTVVDGCLLSFEPAVTLDPARPPTWTDSVGSLVRENCGTCHRADRAAPFELWTFRDAAKRRERIAEVVRRRQMPPWHASRHPDDFVNVRRLTDDARERILAWAAAGAPAGDLEAHPDPERPVSNGAWRIGDPDLVLRQAGRTVVPASGVVPYQYVVLPHVFAADTWVEAVEIRPENPRPVHHANLGWVRLGTAFTTENFVTGYVPGGDVYALEPGQAYLIPAGSLLGLQAHYVTTGEATSDRLSVGLRFPKSTVAKRARVLEVANKRFSLAPFAPAQPVSATRRFPGDATGIGMFVHMHLRGRDVRVRAIDEAGGEAPLLLVPNYDFDWQGSYRWAKDARRFAANTRVRAEARFDNSSFNAFNPDPSARVSVGEATEDEMMYVFVFYTLDQESLGLEVDPLTGAARKN
jgi:hypothetical protein